MLRREFLINIGGIIGGLPLINFIKRNYNNKKSKNYPYYLIDLRNGKYSNADSCTIPINFYTDDMLFIPSYEVRCNCTKCETETVNLLENSNLEICKKQLETIVSDMKMLDLTRLEKYGDKPTHNFLCLFKQNKNYLKIGLAFWLKQKNNDTKYYCIPPCITDKPKKIMGLFL